MPFLGRLRLLRQSVTPTSVFKGLAEAQKTRFGTEAGGNMVDGPLRRATALNWTKKGIKPKRKGAPRPLVDVAAFNQRKRLSANGSLPRAVQKEFAKLALPPRSTSLPKRPKRFSPLL